MPCRTISLLFFPAIREITANNSTQNIYQDQEATATEVVTRKVRQTDPSISDEKARSALGALGLIGEKAIRKVGHLSGTDSF